LNTLLLAVVVVVDPFKQAVVVLVVCVTALSLFLPLLIR